MPLHRAADRPLLTPAVIPPLRPDMADVSAVFNPGAVRWRGRDLLLLRVQTRGRTTLLVPAEHRADGAVEVLGRPARIAGLERLDPAPVHVYDARLTVIDDACHAVLAADFRDGCRLLTAVTHDFETWRLLGPPSPDDLRNGVLFPEKVGGRWLRLQRPNRSARDGAPRTGMTIVLAESDDGETWREAGPVLDGRPMLWDEWIGSGPPPVKTREGWLHVYHGVATHFASANIYQAGVALLDLADPTRVLARGAFNILEPRLAWELTGQVPNVVFPSGMIVEQVDAEGYALPESRVRVYYGAADTVVGLANATVAELLADARFAG
ncbi:glycoside hydrolase family 130 protein [bacterium]|nr:glycoside hydrolase family 130 protein [bacterium]